MDTLYLAFHHALLIPNDNKGLMLLYCVLSNCIYVMYVSMNNVILYYCVGGCMRCQRLLPGERPTVVGLATFCGFSAVVTFNSFARSSVAKSTRRMPYANRRSVRSNHPTFSRMSTTSRQLDVDDLRVS